MCGLRNLFRARPGPSIEATQPGSIHSALPPWPGSRWQTQDPLFKAKSLGRPSMVISSLWTEVTIDVQGPGRTQSTGFTYQDCSISGSLPGLKRREKNQTVKDPRDTEPLGVASEHSWGS